MFSCVALVLFVPKAGQLGPVRLEAAQQWLLLLFAFSCDIWGLRASRHVVSGVACAHADTWRHSVADGYLFTVLRWTKVHDIDISGYPNITAFMKSMTAPRAVQEAMQAEGLPAGT